MPEYPNYQMDYGYKYGVDTVSDNTCLPLNPATGAFIPRAYFIDQPYVGILPYSEALAKGTVFPNIILPVYELR